MRLRSIVLTGAVLAVSALLLSWARSGPEIAQAVGPEMSLGATGNVTCDTPSKPTKCSAQFDPSDPKTGEFQITVNANVIPVGGYGSFVSEVVFGDLTWNQRPICADEVVLPEPLFVCQRNKGAGLARHQSGLQVPNQTNFVGTLVELDAHCTSEGTFKVTLTAFPSSATGSAYTNPTLFLKTVGTQEVDLDGDTVPETVDVADTLDINCVPPGVGGIAELPEAAETPLEAVGSSGPSAGVLAGAVVGAVALGVLALGGAAWYARRRRS